MSSRVVSQEFPRIFRRSSLLGAPEELLSSHHKLHKRFHWSSPRIPYELSAIGAPKEFFLGAPYEVSLKASSMAS